MIFFNGKSDITLEINGENIVAVFIQKSIAILELKEKKFVYFYHTTDEQNKQGLGQKFWLKNFKNFGTIKICGTQNSPNWPEGPTLNRYTVDDLWWPW